MHSWQYKSQILMKFTNIISFLFSATQILYQCQWFGGGWMVHLGTYNFIGHGPWALKAAYT